MDELTAFGEIVLVVAAGFTLALLSTKVSERFPVPSPAIFLLAASLASEIFPALEPVSIREVERIGVVAVLVILFEGGMGIGLRRFRRAAVPITLLGLVGTLATAGLMAVFAHAVVGFSWTVAWILAAALAPTDPAVTFSVLGDREIRGRTGLTLEGESGINDPVGVALVIGMIDYAAHADSSLWAVPQEFAIEMSVGLAIGIAGGLVLVPLARRFSLPSESLYPLRTLLFAGVVYGAAAAARGSGFLAVFVAGLIVGDARLPFKGEIERFQSAMSSLAELVVFVALGLTVDLTSLGRGHLWLDGLALAALLAFVARPAVATVLLLPVRFRWRERLFVSWGGLKGAVPILLAAFAVLGRIEGAERIYDIVFVVVAFSVVVNGTLIPSVADRLAIPMTRSRAAPWTVSVDLEHEPRGLRQYVVATRSRADGTAVRELPLGEHAWISLVIRDGAAVQPRGSHVLRGGDEVVVLTEPEHEPAIRRVFEGV